MDELDQLRQQNQQLQDQLKRFEGINPDEARRQQQTSSQQIERLTQQTQQLTEQLQNKDQAIAARDIRQAALEGVYDAKVLPEYRDILMGQVQNNLKQEGDRIVAPGGKDPREYVTSLREKYPAMFAPDANPVGSGATGSTGSTPPPSSQRVVEAQNGLIANVDPDAVLKGDIVIK